MADDMSPEQIAELQKKNCIFCKIISSEIESKKVFESESYIAILDIRPAANGHVLFLPKDHVPILPLLGEEKIIDFFNVGTQVAHAVREAMIAQRVTMMIASGYAAGQQAPHLMMHIIPREKGDGLDMLDLESRTVDQAETIALSSIFAQATTQMLKHMQRADLLEAHVPVQTPVPATPPIAVEEAEPPVEQKEETEEFTSTNEALEAALAMAPDLRKLIIAQPDLVEEYVQRSPKLAKLFTGVNIRALSLMLQRQEAKQAPERQAKDMTDEELMQFIDGNQGLRSWMIEQPEELVRRIPENPRLQSFFEGIDILALAKKYRDSRGAP